MSNIIDSNKDSLLKLKEILSIVQKSDLNKSDLEYSLQLLLPKKNDQNLINYQINNKNKHAAFFNASPSRITIFLDATNKWLNKQVIDFLPILKSSDEKALKNYFLIFVIAHEIEHSYEFLMSEGIVNAPNDILKKAYKGIFDLFIRTDSIVPQPIKRAHRIISRSLYRKKQDFYLLERNANIEGADLICRLALFDNREDIYELFKIIKHSFERCGYINSCKGSIEETYHDLLLYRKFKKFNHNIELSSEERIRYGFSIDEPTRIKVLNK